MRFKPAQPAPGQTQESGWPPHFTVVTHHPLYLGDRYPQRHEFTWLHDDNLAVPEHQVRAFGPHALGPAFLSWHHVQDKPPAVRELARVLRPGGRLLLRENFSDHIPPAG